MTDLETKFDDDMHWLLAKESEIGLCSTRLREMIIRLGGVETAKRLLKLTPKPNTFRYLVKMGRLDDLAVESYVVKEEYASLFDKELHIEAARYRLDKWDEF